MNNGNSFDESTKTKKYILEFRNLCESGNYEAAVHILDVFKIIPEELHETATDAIIKIAGISPRSCYRTGLKFLTWKKAALPLNSFDRERLLSTVLDLAMDLDRQDYQRGELWELSKIDDPRAFETLVLIYKDEKFLERKDEVVYGLGTRGREDSLPVLLDYIYRQIANPTEVEVQLLKKYPIAESRDSSTFMDVDDRDEVVIKLIKYLHDKIEHSDALRTAMAHTLAMLYASNLTSITSKELIKASADVAICYGYDEYVDGPVGYLYLKEFVNFSEGNSL